MRGAGVELGKGRCRIYDHSTRATQTETAHFVDADGVTKNPSSDLTLYLRPSPRDSRGGGGEGEGLVQKWTSYGSSGLKSWRRHPLAPRLPDRMHHPSHGGVPMKRRDEVGGVCRSASGGLADASAARGRIHRLSFTPVLLSSSENENSPHADPASARLPGVACSEGRASHLIRVNGTAARPRVYTRYYPSPVRRMFCPAGDKLAGVGSSLSCCP